jgi:hypothetical protein
MRNIARAEQELADLKALVRAQDGSEEMAFWLGIAVL